MKHKLFSLMAGHRGSTLAGVFVRLAGLGLGFLLQIAMARVLGSGEYGAFVYAMTLVSLAAMLVVGGLDLIMVRELGGYFSPGGYKIPRFAARWLARELMSRVGFVAVGLGMTWLLVPSDASWSAAFVVLGMAFPLLAGNALWGVLLQAMRRVVWAQALTMALPQLLLLGLFAIFLWQGETLDAEQASFVQVGGQLAVFLFGGWLVFRGHVSMELIDGRRDAVTSGWNVESRRLLWFTLLGYGVAKVDLLLLGAWQPIEEVGRYNVASRMAELTGIFLAASNQFLAPRIAAVHRDGTREELQRMLTNAIRGVFLASLWVAALLIFAAPVVLQWYGRDFGGAFWPMAVLVAGQIINVALGPVGYFLAMVGKSQIMIRAYIVGFVLNVGGSLVLIPIFGILGAAVANAVSMAAWNLAMYQWIRRNMKIDTSVFAWPVR